MRYPRYFSTAKATKPSREPSGARVQRVARWGLCAAVLASCTVPAGAPTGSRARLVASRIDERDLVTLTGNTHPRATSEYLIGKAPGDLQIDHLQLVLQRAPDEEATLQTHIDALHDKTSPRYQQWLSAADFGDQYGVDQVDVALVTKWLTSYGLRIDGVPRSRMFVEFSGTVAQIAAAFHVEMGKLSVKGAPHLANLNDPQIPKELAKVVAGVYGLHDFMPHAMNKKRGAVKRDHLTGAWSVVKPSPDFAIGPYGGCAENSDCTLSNVCNLTTGVCGCTSNAQCSATFSGGAATCNTTTQTCVQCVSNADCVFPATCNTATNQCLETFQAVTPADFATIYNLNPLFAEGITGAGQTVVVVEDTLMANTSDVATFRTAFGLNAYPGTFSQISPTGSAACTSPGVNGDEGEAALDAEWASATAPSASIVLAACKDTTVFGGLLALENLINGTSPPQVVSMSYGECEASNGTTSNQQFVNTYQQAAAEGVSVFVSSGDEGAASCDADLAAATKGISVSGWASTPYNVAVGGTDFIDYYNSQNGGPAVSTYWNATNTPTFGSALGYVPEMPWNDSCASKLIYSSPQVALGTYTQAYGASGFCASALGKSFQTTGAGSGGPSNFSAQPTWQTGVVGLPTKSGGKRNLPDVSLFAANGVWGHFLVYCLTDTAQGGGPCTYTSDADSLLLAAGGTSFASPSMAGIQALINQKMGGPQGNPNYTYYKLAGAEQGAKGSTRCNASVTQLPQPECIFNDVTQGDIDVNCTETRQGVNNGCFGTSGTGKTAVPGVLSTSTTTLGPAYPAGTGWDYATGLGTVNAYNLVNAWSQ